MAALEAVLMRPESHDADGGSKDREVAKQVEAYEAKPVVGEVDIRSAAKRLIERTSKTFAYLAK